MNNFVTSDVPVATVPAGNQITDSAKSLINQLEKKINAQGVSETVKSDLIASRDSLNYILNSAFTQSGIISQSQIDSVNATFANTKKKILEAEAQQTNRNFVVFSAAALISGALIYWYFKRMKK
jgi:hypothetical protein